MKVLLTIGHQYSGFDLVYQALLGAGLKSAKFFRDGQFSPELLQKKILNAHQEDINVYTQLNPSQLWQGLSSDLFVANLEQDLWGWADTNTIYLLNYWRDFDPRTRFILVYASPALCLSRLLRTEDNAVELIESFCVDWFNFNEALLSFYNRNQDRCLLVNAEALTVENSNVVLLNIAQSRFEITLNDSLQFSNIENDKLLDIFSVNLNQEYPYLEALYQELESAAEVYLGVSTVVDKTLSSSCAYYKQVKDELISKAIKIQNLVHELDISNIQVQTIADLQTQIQLLTQVTAEQLKEKNAQIEILLLQLHQVQEELERYFLNLDTEKKDKVELVNKVIKLKNELTEVNNKLSFINSDQVNLKAKLVQQEKENKLLLLQLHQVQEELEHYFLKYQEALEVKPANKLPDHYAVDLRQQVDGYNWWHAEHDGRWAGPNLESSVRLPMVKTGLYQLRIEIVDEISPDILKNTQFFLENKRLNLVNINWLKQLIGLKKRYPIILTTKVKLTDSTDQSVLLFKFPKVISPASKGKGSDDFRSLAIRVKAVELKLIKLLP